MKRNLKYGEKTPPPMKDPTKWNLRSLPAEKHSDVGPYFYTLYEEALRERDRLGLPERWLENYRLYRGDHWEDIVGALTFRKKKSRTRLSLALLQANIHRTVANITARSPIAEVKNVSGIEDGIDSVLSERMKVWYNDEEQQRTLNKSVLNQEIYGITIEKTVFDGGSRQGRSIPLDPFSFLPAPGYYEELNDAPYLIHVYSMPIEEIEAKYDVTGVEPDEEIGKVLGEEREDERIPIKTGTRVGSANASGNYVPTNHPKGPDEVKSNRALVIEIWIRDYSTEEREIPMTTVDPQTGQEVEASDLVEVPKYPGGIRVVTITNYGKIVLADQKNPNVNHAMPYGMIENTYLFNKFPFYHANSYEDTTSLWGFSLCETCGDINLAIDELWSTITAYMRMAMFPPLILPKDTKIPKSRVQYLPRLTLRPVSGTTGDHIRWLDMPSPPQWLFESLNTLLGFFDRISQVEDADRGQASGGVVAASAIQMLQERGAVLIRAKIRSVDYLVRERGRCFISFFQNFGVIPEYVDTEHGPVELAGINLIDRKFNYIVEAGSTVAKTSSQIQQEALELYKLQAIDREGLLRQINFPGWKEVLERMGESQLQAAFQILIQAGLPEDIARQMYNTLLEDQGGPGDLSQQNPPGGGVGKAGAPAEAGVPKAMQGQTQEAN